MYMLAATAEACSSGVFSIIKDTVTLSLAGGGLYLAWSGLSAWKREHVGKRDIELCQSVITSFYEAHDKLRALRSPFAYPESESEGRARRENEADDERRVRDQHYVPLARLEKQSAFWSDFFGRRFLMRAIFSESGNAPYLLVDEALREFRAAASTRYASIQRGRIEIDSETNRGFDRILWEVSDDDKLNSKLTEAIKKMEDVCVPIIRSGRR